MGDFDLDKYRSVGAIRGRNQAWGTRVRETRTEEGRVKATTDDLNNTVTQHSKGDRQDVHIRATTVHGFGPQ